MQMLAEIIFIAVLVLIPGAAMYFAYKLKQDNETLRIESKEKDLKNEIIESNKEIDRLDSKGLVILANDLYNGDGSKRPDNK